MSLKQNDVWTESVQEAEEERIAQAESAGLSLAGRNEDGDLQFLGTDKEWRNLMEIITKND